MLPSVVPRLATDSAVRVFPRKENLMDGASVVAYLEAVTQPAPCLQKMSVFEIDTLAIRSLMPVS